MSFDNSELRFDNFLFSSLKIIIIVQSIILSNSLIISILLSDIKIIFCDNSNDNIELKKLSSILELNNIYNNNTNNFFDNIELCNSDERFENNGKCIGSIGDSLEDLNDYLDDYLIDIDDDDKIKNNDTQLEVTILGLFELTQSHQDGSEARPEGPSELQAAKLAIDHINNKAILPKFKINLIYNDTKCDPGVAVDRFFYAQYKSNKKTMPFLLGSACSEPTETLAKIVPYWNMIQVSYGSTAPALSGFPLFVRTVAPDSSHNTARISIIKYFGWDTITALSQNSDKFSLAVNDLVTELEAANITCTATITFSENDYKEQLKLLKELDTRIIVGSFSSKLAPLLFCEAWKLEMFGGDYAWILPDETIDLSGMTSDWWHVSSSGPGSTGCSSSQLAQALDGVIIVKSYDVTSVFESNQSTSSGMTSVEFKAELAKRGVTVSKYSATTYDAVWSMGLALSKLENILNQQNLTINEYTLSRRNVIQRLLKEFKSLNFNGISGPVSFEGADRIGITAFYQMHGHVLRKIAIYTPNNEKLTMNCLGCAQAKWPNRFLPPVAKRVFRIRMVTIDRTAFLVITSISSFGISLSISFLIFNLHYRRRKSIKISSPRLNNLAAFGCVLVYGAVILLGLDDSTLSKNYFPTICTARVYLLSAGFSLAFGSMFTKTYRVHRIFTTSRSGVIKNKLLQDTQLISLICVLLFIDGIVVTLWITLDPMERYLRNLTLEINPEERGVVYQPQIEVCRSQHTNGWLASLYAYKGVLLVVGVYMAWETRHVKIPALNDSQYIGMSVYSVIITSGIVVVLANLMSDRATLAFITITTLILTSTTATLLLLFLPQLNNVIGGEAPDPIVQSLGLKIECNTRRFVTEDKRELQYRVEVQNRVYRREMAQLELQLARLEKKLAGESINNSTSSSVSIPQRNTSIGGGLPLLLLSILPPVIPRASWPSTNPSGIHRESITFRSHPEFTPVERITENNSSINENYNYEWRRETEGPHRLGVFQRFVTLFNNRTDENNRKDSTTSYTGVASVLKIHMGLVPGLVTGTNTSSDDNAGDGGAHGSGPIIHVTSQDDRRSSLNDVQQSENIDGVSFSLLSNDKSIKNTQHCHSQHCLTTNNHLNLSNDNQSMANQRWHSMEDTTITNKTKKIIIK